jgi:hypothetical protein
MLSKLDTIQSMLDEKKLSEEDNWILRIKLKMPVNKAEEFLADLLKKSGRFSSKILEMHIRVIEE